VKKWNLSALMAALFPKESSQNQPRFLLDTTTQWTVQRMNLQSSGIGRVVNRLTFELLKRPPQGLAVMPVRADNDLLHFRVARRYQASLLGEFFVGREERVKLSPGDHFFAMDLNHSLVHRTAFLKQVRQNGGRLSGLVYDLLPLQRPDWFPPGLAQAHHRWFDTLSQFDDLVCISRTVAEDVLSELQQRMPGHQHPRVSWFHLGCELPTKPKGELPQQLLERPTVLLVSILWKRKGHEQTLDAFEQLWNAGENVNLVFAGQVGWGLDSLISRIEHHPEKGKRLFWFNGPDDGLLGQLYARCTGVLVASEGEGFGLPVVEALAHKRPVLVRDLPVFKEIAGDRVTYFRADSADQLAQALHDWMAVTASGMPCEDVAPPLSWSEATVQLLSALNLKAS
jgi:glycosyltransferase involved in cell wall biosynthesis